MPEKPKIDFFANGLCSACQMAQNELLDFKAFHKTTEESWEKIDTELNSKVDEILKKYPEDVHDEIIEYHSWDFYLNQEKYPSIHRKSLVITIYSFLEIELNNLCGILSQSVDSNLKLKDINGKGFERAQTYLSKVANLDFSRMGGTLPFVKGVNNLRNLLVHNDGILPHNPNDAINTFVTNQKNIMGEPGSIVRFNSAFIEELIEKLIQFFSELDIEVQKHIQSNI
jgi:hypothetical protein